MNGLHHNKDNFENMMDCCSLKQLTNDRWGTIMALPHERQSRDRLIGMGVIIGQIFQVIHNAPNGPVILCIDQQRIALDSELAGQIQVVPKPETERSIASAVTRLKQIWSLQS